ncbi:hypothetical protein A2U01_0113781, partial [Trifolium medium]|nr:hypothetical protein [Trifolium medium]
MTEEGAESEGRTGRRKGWKVVLRKTQVTRRTTKQGGCITNQ